MNIHKVLIFLLVFWSLSVNAQSFDCDSTFFKVIGDPDKREEGHSLAMDQAGDFYIGGTQDNRGLLLKCSPNGDVLWGQTLDFSPEQEFISEIMLDSDGMIAGCGYLGNGSVSGQAFAFRFNPLNQQVVWARTYDSGETFIRGMMELGFGGNYLLSSDTQGPNDTEFIEVDRLSGNPVGGNRQVYSLGSAETINEMEIVGDFIYCAGRYTDGNDFPQMRGTVTKLNLSDRSVVWTVLTHLPTAAIARFYTQDMVVENNTIISITSGDDNGISITQTEFFLQKTDFDGNVTLLKKFDVQGFTNEFMEELVIVPDGYVAYGRTSLFSPADLLVVKVDKNFNLLWAKRIDYALNDNLTQVASLQSKCLAVGGDVYFTGVAENNTQGTSDVLFFKINAAGEINDSCLNIVFPVNVTVTDIPNPFVNNVAVTETTAPLFSNNVATQTTDVGFMVSENPCPCPDCVVQSTALNVFICSGKSFVFNGNTLTTAGLYVDTLSGVGGCDSIVALELSLFPYYTSQLAVFTCDGMPFVFNGQSYSQTGIYQIPYPDQNGCDSLVVLNVVVNPIVPPTLFFETICEGESYEFFGQNLTTSGSYTQSYTTLAGCDSSIVLQLTVQEPQDTSLSVLLCEGQAYDGYTDPGFYTDTLQTFAGCDSIRMLQLSFQLPADSVDVGLCDGEAILGFTENGVYIDTVYGSDGCDTLRTYFVTANNLYVPNVFSPDDNGINDHFEIFLSEPTSIQITYFAMFDRWGNMVYEVKDNNVVKWDGDFRGKPMNPSVLSYVLLYRCNGFEKNRHGSVTVVR